MTRTPSPWMQLTQAWTTLSITFMTSTVTWWQRELPSISKILQTMMQEKTREVSSLQEVLSPLLGNTLLTGLETTTELMSSWSIQLLVSWTSTCSASLMLVLTFADSLVTQETTHYALSGLNLEHSTPSLGSITISTPLPMNLISWMSPTSPSHAELCMIDTNT